MDGAIVTSPVGPASRRRAPTAAALIAIVAVGIALLLAVTWAVLPKGAAGLGSGSAGSCDAAAVARNVLPSVVTVETTTAQGGGNGSGQIVRAGGFVLTNYHVIASAAGGAGAVAVRYADGARTPATIVGLDPRTDLAVVKADDGAAGRPIIAVGSSGGLVVGQPVVALGPPLGLTRPVTAGIGSAPHRYVPLSLGSGQTGHPVHAVQTDASINPGNSGGALVDCAGRLVGVPSAIITAPNSAGQTGGGSIGLGFAIPIDLAGALADQLIATGRANHPIFGLQAQPIIGPSGASTGLFVSVVVPGGPAEQAGLRVGDILAAVGGSPARSVAQLEKLALVHNAGDSIAITFTRGGSSMEAAVVLGEPVPVP